MERPRTIAYVRSASEEYEWAEVRAALGQLAQESGLGEVEWVEEIASGLAPWYERQIAIILAELQVGDHLLIRDLTRLSRSRQQTQDILALAAEKGILIHTLNPPKVY